MSRADPRHRYEHLCNWLPRLGHTLECMTQTWLHRKRIETSTIQVAEDPEGAGIGEPAGWKSVRNGPGAHPASTVSDPIPALPSHPSLTS